MRRAVVTILVDEHTRSIVSACRIAGLSRTAFHKPPQAGDNTDAPFVAALTPLIAQEGRWAFWKCRNRLRDLGHHWNNKRIQHAYCVLRLKKVRCTKKRVPTRFRVPLEAVRQLNDTWARDFMGDTLYSAQNDRILNVIEEGNREASAIEVDVSLPSECLVAVLEQLVAIHGASRRIRCDNGPEFVSEVVRARCERHGIMLVLIQPGKPNQNTYIECFNRTYRTEILNAWVFTTLDEVRELSEAWRQRYNTEQTHDSLGRIPPLTFPPRTTSPDRSTFQLYA